MLIPADKLLVVRNDKLGDFVLALPAFALLRRSLPNAEICALVPRYTAPLARLSPAIDRIIIDPGQGNADGAALTLAKELAGHHFDAAISLFSTNRTGIALLAARIPYRLAPATKLAQIFYNNRLTQRRSRSTQPEFEYNLDLARYYLRDCDIAFGLEIERPVLSVAEEQIAARRRSLAEQYGITANSVWIFVHPGHGGSANNLSVEQYAQLINALGTGDQHSVIVTAGPGEEDSAHALLARLTCGQKCVHRSSGGLDEFVTVLATADLFVSGSTGPAHIAGALNRCTAVFYPRRLTSSPLRWQTLNDPGRRVAFTPPPASDERDMSAIDPTESAVTIRRAFAHLNFIG